MVPDKAERVSDSGTSDLPDACLLTKLLIKGLIAPEAVEKALRSMPSPHVCR
jgi:hypothetical protein